MQPRYSNAMKYFLDWSPINVLYTSYEINSQPYTYSASSSIVITATCVALDNDSLLGHSLD